MFTVNPFRQLVASHADWWAMAGFDAAVGEHPGDWLAPAMMSERAAPAGLGGPHNRSIPPAPVAAPAQQPSPATATPAPLFMPGEWEAFHAWLANGDGVPGSTWHPRRILPQGRPGARLMLFSLCPELDDQENGTLHSGMAGKLADAMLAGIGLDRSDCYLASLALTRPPGGRLDTSQATMLMPLLWHHLRLARPERLLLFGGDLTRMVIGEEIGELRGQLRHVNHEGVKVEAAAIQHPMLLLDRPPRKRAAWDSLKLLARG